MFTGRLLAIGVAPSGSEPMESCQSVEAITGQGLTGDRYTTGQGTFQDGPVQPTEQVTLIEREAIEAACRDYQLAITHLDTRRNLLTEEVPLNHLVGREVLIGEVILRGLDLCEPCGHLENLTCPDIKRALLHRGGLRAEVVRGGILQVGQTVCPAVEPSP
ncbi:MAG: MOSC domain-containing protein [Planctomycetaceae bacterium]|nr:MOSC domain-containing protein [Planctomycetaceae bacterium]